MDQPAVNVLKFLVSCFSHKIYFFIFFLLGYPIIERVSSTSKFLILFTNWAL